MKKKVNGFTLIELLAIIVILAIIATITMPIILGIIERVKKDATVTSISGIEDAIKLNHYELLTNNTEISEDYTYNCDENGCFATISNINKKIETKGEQPTGGIIYVGKDGSILKIENLLINGFICSKENKDSQVSCRISNNLTLTYDLNGGSRNNCTKKTVTYGNPYGTLCDKSLITAPEAKEFDGWWTSKEGGERVDENDIVLSSENITLYAHWKENNGIVPTVLNNDYLDGEHEIVTGGVTYPVRIINIHDGQTGDDDELENGVITIASNKEYGDTSDVATKDEYAKRMVIVKYHGDVTINPEVTITSIKSEEGYGGPKGMYLCSTGTITNNGTISMTARGAKAQGEDVYLYSSDLINWEFVPAIGAQPGTTATMNTATSSYSLTGANGKNASTVTTSPRATGGGGQGGMRKTNNSVKSKVIGGIGTAGTSYSGGSGGGGATQNNTSTAVTGGAAKEFGGSGGIGVYKNSGGAAVAAGGGAGNPGGNYAVANKASSDATILNKMKGASGTGGLLIIYGENIINNGIISSNGSAGGLGNNSTILGSDDYPKSTGGGGSGGGSINIFYKTQYTTSDTAEITFKGGSGGYGGITDGATRGSGGTGGQGSSTITQIEIK